VFLDATYDSSMFQKVKAVIAGLSKTRKLCYRKDDRAMRAI